MSAPRSSLSPGKQTARRRPRGAIRPKSPPLTRRACPPQLSRCPSDTFLIIINWGVARPLASCLRASLHGGHS
ncbi:hypothetical protein E2C01_100583 [Portunus trituberculatus]|uniref:Uncharacterized protein n=1 Tax=Portunus trituberculatus TaxID=210409 RepID=A0A5B7K7A6_PORTR|nr:hypothetical protein [Portunus trituberculatus]